MNETSIKKIVGLGGSLREASYTCAALRAGMDIAKGMGFATEMLDLRLLKLPVFIPDLPIEGYPRDSQEAVRQLVASFRNATAMLWAKPNYHGAMSGAFKNAIDFMEFLSDDAPPYMQGRTVGLISVSDSSPLGSMANCVHELRAWLAPTRVTLTKEDFSPGLTLGNASANRRLTRLVTELMEFKIQRHF